MRKHKVGTHFARDMEKNYPGMETNMYRLFAKLNRNRPAPKTANPMAAPLLWGSMLAALFLGIAVEQPAHASSRIKDIIDFEGVRDNMLVGYGIVVGLNGTGDDLTNSPFTSQSLVGMLERMGVNTRGVTLKTKNVAAVIVTATLPSFSRQGNPHRHIRVGAWRRGQPAWRDIAGDSHGRCGW